MRLAIDSLSLSVISLPAACDGKVPSHPSIEISGLEVCIVHVQVHVNTSTRFSLFNISIPRDRFTVLFSFALFLQNSLSLQLGSKALQKDSFTKQHHHLAGDD